MRTVFITLFKEGLGGGEGRAAHEMARCFAAWHDIALICPGSGTALCEAGNGLKVFNVESAGEGNVCVSALSAKNVNKIFSFLDGFEPDIVHAHEPASIGLVGQVWAKMNGVPFVYTTHVLPTKAFDFGALDTIKILRSSLTESVARQGLIDFYRNCDALIALNRSAAEDIRRFGYEGRLFMIPNGRDLRRYGSCSNADVSSPERILTFIGYINSRKNQLYLLEVLKHLPENYRLQIVGEPLSSSYDQQLKDFVEENNLSNVTFAGQVEHEDIPAYLEGTHVFVSASKMEVQSLVVIEALASGTPVVGLSNETIDDLVDEEVGFGLSKDTAPEEFARCVERVCNLPQPEYDVMCEHARGRVKGLDWMNVMTLLVEAYESLLRERPLVTEESHTGLAHILSHMPPGEVKESFTQRVMSLEKMIQGRVDLEPRSPLASKLRQAKRVPGSTWFFAGLTIPVSLACYLLLKSSSSASRMKRSAALEKLDRIRRRERQTDWQY